MDRLDALALLRGGPEGVAEWNRRRSAGEAIPNLARAHLVGTYLPGDEPREVYLGGADPLRADLADADLAKAHLREANLGGGALRGAHLVGADLIRADLS